MFTFPLHLSSSVGVRFTRSFVFCVMLRSSLFVSFFFSLFFVGHYIVCPSSMHGLWYFNFFNNITYNVQEYNILYNSAIPALYVMVDILLTSGKHLRTGTTVLLHYVGRFGTHTTCLTAPLFIEVSVPSQESHVCVC
jgi:hypothetical protein